MTGNDGRTSTDKPPRLSVARFSGDLVDEVFSADRGLPWTLWQLTRRPGATIRRYVDWRDPRVTRPVRYYIVALTIAGLLLWSSDASVQFSAGFEEGAAPYARPIASKSPLLRGFLDILKQPTVLLALTFVPSLALALERGYRRSGVNLAEAFAMSFYITAHASLLFALGAALFETMGLGTPAGEIVLLVLALGAYPVCAIYGAFEGVRALRAVGTVALAFALAFLLSVMLAFAHLAIGF